LSSRPLPAARTAATRRLRPFRLPVASVYRAGGFLVACAPCAEGESVVTAGTIRGPAGHRREARIPRGLEEGDVKPVSLQLYTLRERARQDLIGALRATAAIGYLGVEPAGLFGHEPSEIRRIVEDLGMTVSSNHQPWPDRDNLNEVIDVAAGLGARTVVCGFGREAFAALDGIKAAAETANLIVERLGPAGLSVVVHNHWWEFEKLEGRLKYDVFMEMCPALGCEIDTYWASNFGAHDVAAIVAKYASRTPLLHVKDGIFEREKPQKPLGAGRMDLPRVIHAADDNVLQWLVVELDNADRDMLQAVEESYAYLTKNGLARGAR
jgi:sugar phosphate isomerase/epimerase